MRFLYLSDKHVYRLIYIKTVPKAWILYQIDLRRDLDNSGGSYKNDSYVVVLVVIDVVDELVSGRPDGRGDK